MTERFKSVGNDIFQYGDWWCSAKGEHCADVIATAMNELIDDNVQLKEHLKDSVKQNQRIFDLIDKHIDECRQGLTEVVTKTETHRLEFMIHCLRTIKKELQ